MASSTSMPEHHPAGGRRARGPEKEKKKEEGSPLPSLSAFFQVKGKEGRKGGRGTVGAGREVCANHTSSVEAKRKEAPWRALLRVVIGKKKKKERQLGEIVVGWLTLLLCRQPGGGGGTGTPPRALAAFASAGASAIP